MPVFQPNTAISHAYALICANEAQRERETTELAAAMLCSSLSVRPCRVCRDCKKVLRAVHPDVLYTDPTGSAKTAAINFVGDKAFYTLDGSDPRCSDTAVAINANATGINVNGKSIVRAVAFDGNKAVSWRGSEATVG
jgi:hypothetical protein